MPKPKNNIIVKKIKPYPFPIQLTHEGQAFTGQVVKMVMHGCMVDLGATVVLVGDIHQMQFTLPTDEALNVGQVKVIKTYDRYQPVEGQKAMRLAEFHFVNASDDMKSRIKQFLKLIKQIGTDMV